MWARRGHENESDLLRVCFQENVIQTVQRQLDKFDANGLQSNATPTKNPPGTCSRDHSQRFQPEPAWSFSLPLPLLYCISKRGPVCPAYPYYIPHYNLPTFPSLIMSRNALNLLRSATSSLSPAAVTGPYYPAYRRAAIRFRNYSGTAPENVNGTSQGPGDAADTQEPVPPLSELETKLKTKEDEVLDLTVRLSRQQFDVAALSDLS
jgi:hypothetical protein